MDLAPEPRASPRPKDRPEVWALVLAAGDGRRVQGLTTDARGEAAPKQFTRFGAGTTLLGAAMTRGARLAGIDRTVVIVAEQHRRWWREQLASVPPANIVVQPRNRGTGAGILLPLLSILGRDPDAVVAVLPSDHHVDHEVRLRTAVMEAVGAVHRAPERVVLVGIEPAEADGEYGWIVPSAPSRSGSLRSPRPVAAFVEKPDVRRAEDLMRAGALVNTFIFAARGGTLVNLYRGRLPRLLEALRDWRASDGAGRRRLASVYETLSVSDFSRDLLQPSSRVLSVVSASGCGWVDLGTPERLSRFRRTRRATSRVPPRVTDGPRPAAAGYRRAS